MMWLLRAILFLPLFLMASLGSAQWWNFGKTEDKVSFKYIYVAGVSMEEIGPKLTVYRDFMPNGEVQVRGQAIVQKGQIGSVRFSLDEKETWKEAKLGAKGAFEFAFRGEPGQTYELYIEATDTTGTTNPVDKTKTTIVVSELDLREAIRRALEAMARAYMDESRRSFMVWIDQDFLTDKMTLERAIGKDFSAFDNLQLQLTIDQVTPGKFGQATVLVNFNRSLIGTKSGQNFKDRGKTRFAFRLHGEGVQCYSMSHPLIFGLSDAVNVGSDVIQGGNDEVISISDGDISVITIGDAIQIWTGSDTGSQAGRVTLRWSEEAADPADWWFESFNFEDRMKERETQIAPFIQGNFCAVGSSFTFNLKANTQYVIDPPGVSSLDDLRVAPDSGYFGQALFPLYDEGYRVIVFKLGGTKYAALEILDMVIDAGGKSGRIVFKYKYTARGPRF
jgi:hypothetical protein